MAKDGEIEIDDDNTISHSDANGQYVLAWVWVDNPEEVPIVSVEPLRHADGRIAFFVPSQPGQSGNQEAIIMKRIRVTLTCLALLLGFTATKKPPVVQLEWVDECWVVDERTLNREETHA